MTFFTLVLIAVIILAVIGLGWQTFTVAVLDGFDRTLDVGIPILKNLTQEAQDVQAQTNNNNNMTSYENKTLGIAFDYPTGWEVSQWDFSELADDELSVEPTSLRIMSDNPTPEEQERFGELLKTKLTIKILDIEEFLNPDTLQLESVSVPDFCDGLRASLSDETLETSSFGDDRVYWLSNQIGKDEITTVANQTACRIDSIALHDDRQERFDIDVYFQKDDKAYMLTFSTAPTDVPTMAPIGQKMIESFRFL